MGIARDSRAISAARVFGVSLRTLAVSDSSALSNTPMRQEVFDHRRIFDARNHFYLSATGRVSLAVDFEHALQ